MDCFAIRASFSNRSFSFVVAWDDPCGRSLTGLKASVSREKLMKNKIQSSIHKAIQASIILTLNIVSFQCFAEESIYSKSIQNPSQSIIQSNNQVIVSYINQKMSYEEMGNGIFGTFKGLIDSDKGRASGYEIELSTMNGLITPNGYASLKLSKSEGVMQYLGQQMNGFGYYGQYHFDSSAIIKDIELKTGKGFNFYDNSMLTPYAQIKHHNWRRGINAGLVYQHESLQIGLLAQYSPAERIVFSFNSSIGRTIHSRVTINPNAWSIWNDGYSTTMGNSIIFEVGTKIDVKLTSKIHWHLGVDYEKFKYGMSPIIEFNNVPLPYSSWEPDSVTKYLKIKTGVGFEF
jgi:hypothetical protein